MTADSPGCSGFLTLPGTGATSAQQKGFMACVQHPRRGEAWHQSLALYHFAFALSTQLSPPAGPCSLLPTCRPLTRLVVKWDCERCSLTEVLVPFFPSIPRSLFPQNRPPGTSSHHALLKGPTSKCSQGMTSCNPREDWRLPP